MNGWGRGCIVDSQPLLRFFFTSRRLPAMAFNFPKKKRPPLDQPQEAAEARMSFGDHLQELRHRLIMAFAGSIFGIAVCLFYAGDLIRFIFAPYVLALRAAHYPANIIYMHPAAGVIAVLMTGLKVGLLVSSPWIIYQAWLFIAAGLYPRERRLVYRYIGPSALLFLAGAAFFFFIVLPVMLWVFLNFNNTVPAKDLRPNFWESYVYGRGNKAKQNPFKYPAGTRKNVLIIPMVRTDPPGAFNHHVALWYNVTDDSLKMRIGTLTLTVNTSHANSLFSTFATLGDYMSFVTFMTLTFALAFELPMAMMVLAQIGIIETSTFLKFWRHAILAIAILCVVLAPTPDVFSFLALLVPVLFLYALGLFLAWVTTRKRRAEQRKLDAEYEADRARQDAESAAASEDVTRAEDDIDDAGV